MYQTLILQQYINLLSLNDTPSSYRATVYQPLILQQYINLSSLNDTPSSYRTTIIYQSLISQQYSSLLFRNKVPQDPNIAGAFLYRLHRIDDR